MTMKAGGACRCFLDAGGPASSLVRLMLACGTSRMLRRSAFFGLTFTEQITGHVADRARLEVVQDALREFLRMFAVQEMSARKVLDDVVAVELKGGGSKVRWLGNRVIASGEDHSRHGDPRFQ